MKGAQKRSWTNVGGVWWYGGMRAYGLDMPDGISALEIEVWATLHSVHPERHPSDDSDIPVFPRDEERDVSHIRGMTLEEKRELPYLLPRLEHFWNLVDMLINYEEEVVIRTPWLDRALLAMIHYDWSSLCGCASCVAGETQIDLNSDLSIEQLCEQNKRPTVMTLHGPVLADVPYLKSEEEMYEVELDDGETITVTSAHKFLTQEGWTPLSACEVGTQLYGSSPYRPQTNSEHDPSAHPVDDRHYSDIAVGSLLHCSAYPHLCGEQLREAQVAALETSPSEADARKCIQCVYENVDGVYQVSSRSHACQLCDHPSSCHGVHPQPSNSNHPCRCLDVGETSSLLHPSCQPHGQCEQESNLHGTFSSHPHDAHHSGCKLCDGLQPLECQCCGDGEPCGHSESQHRGCQQRGECYCTIQTLQQQPSHTPHHACGCNEGEHFHTSLSSDELSYSNKVHLKRIKSIKSVGVKKVYDLNVPVEHHYLAGGVFNHNSGKSFAAALYAVIMYACSPSNSLILITSTSIEGAKIRVWKTVNELWSKLPHHESLGTMVHSKARIRGFNESGEPSDHIGIQIIAAGSGSEEDAYSKLIGLKAGRLYLLADELPVLPRNVNRAAAGNLINGSIHQPFKMVAMGNPSLRLDAFGEMSEPKDGWDSISEADLQWTTHRGICVRFDAEQSPNILAGRDIYPWLPKKADIDAAKRQFGENSLMFYRQYRAYFFSEADKETIYSEADIIQGRANKPFDSEVDGAVASEIHLGGGDPSFTQGGDLFPFIHGRVITTVDGKNILEVKNLRKIEDGVDDGLSKSHSAVKQIAEMCREYNIAPSHYGYDATGAGIAFSDIVAEEWSSMAIAVQFGGKASTFNAGINDPRKAEDVYANRVTELWVRAKMMIKEGMIRGLPEEIVDQMIQRRWNPSGSKKLMVESKVVMKSRVGYSPDWADAFFVLLEVAVVNGLLQFSKGKKLRRRASPRWSEMALHHDLESDNALRD